MWGNKARADLAEAFLAALKEDQIPWKKCWSAAPLSFSTGKPYRGINNLMLSYVADKMGYQDRRWMTYKRAQDNGWQVRRGEKSVRVEHWSYYDKVQKKNLDMDEVRRIQREEPERMKDIRLAAYTSNVFNVEQIDGAIPPMKEEGQVSVEHLTARRELFLANLGVDFGEGGDRAYYSPTCDKIQMPPAKTFTSDLTYMATLLHEAGHSTGHQSRLGRDLTGSFGSPEYAREELRAEIASAFTAQALQLPKSDDEAAFEVENHKAYIQSWISALEEDPDELFAAIKDADKIADYLIEHGRLLELAKAPEAAQMSVYELSQDQLDELKSALFWRADEPSSTSELEPLTEEQREILQAAQFPEEIPDELLYAAFSHITFVPDDFSCSRSWVETLPARDLMEEIELES